MTKAEIVFNKLAKKKEPGPLQSLVPGAVAGTIATSVVMPLDTISDAQKQWRNAAIKTTEEAGLAQAGKSFMNTARELYNPKIRAAANSRGMKAFYSGYGGKMLKVVPSMALTYGIASAIEKKIRDK